MKSIAENSEMVLHSILPTAVVSYRFSFFKKELNVFAGFFNNYLFIGIIVGSLIVQVRATFSLACSVIPPNQLSLRL